MKCVSKNLITILAIMLIAVPCSQAASLQYFGEDRGVFNQDGTPTGTPYTNSLNASTSFLSNLTGVGTETFESYSDGTIAPLNITFPGAGTATLTGGGSIDDDPGTGQNAISGTNWWRTGPDNDFTINFSNPVAAFGFFGIDVGDVGAQLTLTLLDGTPFAIDIPHTVESGGPNSGQNGSVFYFGFIDTDNPWTSASFSNIGSFGDDFGFDDMTIGSVEQVNPVPEPSTVLLLGSGLAGLAWYGRKRKKA